MTSISIAQAAQQAISLFLGEPWDDETKTLLSEAFRKILPGPYKIDWTMEDHTPELKLTFPESPEATEWMLLHR